MELRKIELKPLCWNRSLRSFEFQNKYDDIILDHNDKVVHMRLVLQEKSKWITLVTEKLRILFFKTTLRMPYFRKLYSCFPVEFSNEKKTVDLGRHSNMMVIIKNFIDMTY